MTEESTTKENTNSTSNKKRLEGVVVSNKAKDTVTVLVEKYIKHPQYEKRVRRSKKIAAHDPGNTREVGETVVIEETAPVSKSKRYKVVG